MTSLWRITALMRLAGSRYVAVLSAALLLTACAGETRGTPSPEVRITTGLPGMTFKPLGEALEAAFGPRMPDVRFRVVETAGSVNNLQRLEAGEAELGLALADVAYTAYNGRGGEFAQPARNIRGVAVLHPSAVHVMVPAGSPVRSVADLRGRVGVGPVGSGTAVTSALLLDAFEVPSHAVTTEALPFISAADAVAKSDLDGAFVVAADPVDAVQRATSAGARLIEISGQSVTRLRQDFPFLRPGVIPAGTYPGEQHPVRTMLVDVLLLTRSDLDEQLVRRLTSTLFDVLPDLAVKNDFLRQMDPQRAPATPIPLHAGAALYYRERELSR